MIFFSSVSLVQIQAPRATLFFRQNFDSYRETLAVQEDLAEENLTCMILVKFSLLENSESLFWREIASFVLVEFSSMYVFRLKVQFRYKILIFKKRKSRGLPLGWGSSQLDNWAHKCHYDLHTLISKESTYRVLGEKPPICNLDFHQN